MAEILVTGGAGYIGSHIVRRLCEADRDVVVVDDLSSGHRAAVGGARLVVGDFADTEILDECLGRGVEWIIHMAAFCEVGASVKEPADYYRNNLGRSLALLDAAKRHRIRGMVFSSSAAVYGEPRETPITEDHPPCPTNPYGETKLAFERALGWYSGAYGLRWVALRYFNAAGAHPSAEIGEDHDPESHLVPRLLRSALHGGEETPIFGDDWPTRDGTCIRDYVHVVDLAEAHVLAMRAMETDRAAAASFNLGNGEGFTVLEVVHAIERVTGRRPPTRPAPRRPGDPAVLVASSDRARSELGWTPAFGSLESILGTAWEWHRKRPGGYDSPAG